MNESINNIPTGQKEPLPSSKFGTTSEVSITRKADISETGQKPQFGGNLVDSKPPKKPGTFTDKSDPRRQIGRKKGSTNFMTDFKRAIKGIKVDGGGKLTMTDLQRLHIERTVKEMQKENGKYDKAFIDLMNRYYGEAKQTVDHLNNGKDFPAQQIIGMRIMKDNSVESEVEDEVAQEIITEDDLDELINDENYDEDEQE